MKEFKGTKGPWEVVGAGFNDEGTYYTLNIDLISKDNANLIAAAPDLLEALLRTKSQYMQAGIDAVEGSLNPVEDNHAFINAAIAKALGE